jgi:hypothetical protein
MGMRTANGGEVWLPNDIRAAAVAAQALRLRRADPGSGNEHFLQLDHIRS